MVKAIKWFQTLLHNWRHVPPEMFSICGGGRRYASPGFTYPSCDEAWAQDWANIGMDFRKAVGRLEAELVR